MSRFTRSLAFAAMLLVVGSGVAYTAAPYILQSGVITPGHVASWVSPGVVQDGGSAVTGNLNAVGITANGGTPFCISTAKNPNPRVQLCFGVTADDVAGIYLNSYDGGSIVPFAIFINGTEYQFPSDNPGLGAFRIVSSGTTDTASSLDGTIAWNSASASTKTQNLYACSSGSKGNVLNIKDEKLNASTYMIIVTPSMGQTIDGSSIFAITFDGQSITLQCDGAGNWLSL